MSIARLWDHHAVVYRAFEATDELQDTQRSWVALPAPAGLNCRPNQAWSGELQDHGPGEQEGRARQWFLDKDFDVAARDVLLVESGPEAPAQLRVLSVTRPTAPTAVHHLEINVEVSTEALTDEEDGS